MPPGLAGGGPLAGQEGPLAVPPVGGWEGSSTWQGDEALPGLWLLCGQCQGRQGVCWGGQRSGGQEE